MNCRSAATLDLAPTVERLGALIWRTTDQGMTWTVSQPTRPPFVHHQVDFSQPSPMGFALCKTCGEFVDRGQWAAWACKGTPREATFAPVLLGEVPCALCTAPVAVAPEHWEHVVMFGTTCDGCALGVAA